MVEVRRVVAAAVRAVGFVGDGVALGAFVAGCLAGLRPFVEAGVVAFPHEIPIPPGSALGVVGAAVLWFLAGLAVRSLAELAAGTVERWGADGRRGTASAGACATDASAPTPRTGAGVRLERFARANGLAAGLFAVLLVGPPFAELLLPADAVEGELVFALLSFGAKVLGGPGVVLVAALAFAGVRYGLARRATEALAVGVGCWLVVALAGAALLADSPVGAVVVLVGLVGAAYGVRARDATAFELSSLGAEDQREDPPR